MALFFTKDQRNLDEISLAVWDILQEILARHGRKHLICPHCTAGIGSLAGWWDIFSIHFIQQVEIVDDRSELRG